MAHTLRITQVQDGPSDVVYQYFFASDGASGELTNFPILDPAWLTNGQSNAPFVPAGVPAGKCFNIQQIWYNFSGFNGTLSFDSAVPTSQWLLTPSVDSYFDFRPMGGLADRTPAGDIPEGTLLISTNGFASIGSVGSFVIKVRKMK